MLVGQCFNDDLNWLHRCIGGDKPIGQVQLSDVFCLDSMLKKKFFESVVNIKKLEDIIQTPTYLDFLFLSGNPQTRPQGLVVH